MNIILHFDYALRDPAGTRPSRDARIVNVRRADPGGALHILGPAACPPHTPAAWRSGRGALTTLRVN